MGHLPNGKVVFMPNALPGETHDFTIIDEKPNFVSARSIRIHNPSEKRIPPRCPHFGSCGGCDFQHLPYDCQIKLKTDFLNQYLEKEGLKDSVHVDTMPSPLEWQYRNTAVFHIRNGKAGFFAHHSHDMVPVRDCPILEPGILEKLSTRPASLKDGEIKIRKDTSGHVVASFEKEKTNAFQFHQQTFHVWIKNFFQANTALIPLWLDCIDTYLGIAPGDEVLDLYSGVGIISLHAAKKALKVTGIEFERAAVKRAIINSWVNSIRNCYFFSGASEKLASKIKKADKLILNPPRDGVLQMEAFTLDLKRLAPNVIVYSSCNPATFFRDRGPISACGYALTDITLADMFPQTRHFELVAKFVKK
jgi:tRNA/tmRNA/rRNA uracil-C5-methylase (TrmA/RlmC/RlmD family)